MNNKELEDWVKQQRKIVIAYLMNECIDNPNVGEWPAFEVAPHFAIWAVESKRIKGKIGWWAFSGDCPTDYVSESGKCHPRAALKDLIKSWKECIPYMKQGRQAPSTKFGTEANVKELGSLLEKRISILEDWYGDDGLWEV